MPDNYVLTAQQAARVEANMGLVHDVIKKKIRDPDHLGILKRDDLIQVGYMGLCAAAVRYVEDGPGAFSTFAFRVIYNRMIDAIRDTTLSNSKEFLTDQPYLEIQSAVTPTESNVVEDAYTIMHLAAARGGKPVRNGAQALAMRLEGYSSEEICAVLNAKPAKVRMWIHRARVYLAEVPELQELAAAM